MIFLIISGIVNIIIWIFIILEILKDKKILKDILPFLIISAIIFTVIPTQYFQLDFDDIKNEIGFNNINNNIKNHFNYLFIIGENNPDERINILIPLFPINYVLNIQIVNYLLLIISSIFLVKISRKILINNINKLLLNIILILQTFIIIISKSSTLEIIAITYFLICYFYLIKITGKNKKEYLNGIIIIFFSYFIAISKAEFLFFLFPIIIFTTIKILKIKKKNYIFISIFIIELILVIMQSFKIIKNIIFRISSSSNNYLSFFEKFNISIYTEVILIISTIIIYLFLIIFVLKKYSKKEKYNLIPILIIGTIMIFSYSMAFALNNIYLFRYLIIPSIILILLFLSINKKLIRIIIILQLILVNIFFIGFYINHDSYKSKLIDFINKEADNDKLIYYGNYSFIDLNIDLIKELIPTKYKKNLINIDSTNFSECINIKSKYLQKIDFCIDRMNAFGISYKEINKSQIFNKTHINFLLSYFNEDFKEILTYEEKLKNCSENLELFDSIKISLNKKAYFIGFRNFKVNTCENFFKNCSKFYNYDKMIIYEIN